jgi:hypothetical protein
MSNVAVGGWSPFAPLDKEAKHAFDTAISGLVGVQYTPVAYSSQIVNGTNYNFLCQATPAYPGAVSYSAHVYVYQPLQGQAHITQITPVVH